MRSKLLLTATLFLIALPAPAVDFFVGSNTGAGTSCADTNNADLSTVLLTTIPAFGGSNHTLTICNNVSEGANLNLSDPTHVGLTIQGVTDTITVTQTNATSRDVFRMRAANQTIRDLILLDGSNGIQVFPGGTNANIINVDISGGNNDGIRVQEDGTLIQDVNIIGNATSNQGIDGDETGTNLQIINTTVTSSQQHGMRIRGSVTLTNVTITNAGTQGIRVEGPATLTDATVTTPGTNGIVALDSTTVINTIVTDAGGHGMRVEDTAILTDITITNTNTQGIIVEGSATLTNVAITNAGSIGLELIATADTVSINDISINGTGDDCISALGDGLMITETVAGNNLLQNCGLRGLDLNITGGGISTVAGLTLNSSIAEGIFLSNITGGTFTDFTISDTGSDGLSLSNVDSSSFQVSSLPVNSITNIGDAANEHGIRVAVNSDGNDFDDFSIDGTFDSGLFLASSLTNTFDDFTIENSADDGLSVSTSSIGNTFTNFSIIDTGDDGVFVSASQDNTFNTISLTNPTAASQDGVATTATASGNIFNDVSVDNVTDQCIHIQSDDTTVNTAVLTNCANEGLTADLTGGTQLVIDDLTITGPATTGISIANLDSAVAQSGDVSITDVTITLATTGILLTATSGGIFDDLDIQTNTTGLQLTNADSNHFNVGNASADIFSLNGTGIALDTGSDSNAFENLSVLSNTINGITLDASLSNSFSDSDISSNTGDGFLLTGTSNLNQITDNTIIGNSDEGIEILLGNTNTIATNTIETNAGSGIEVSGTSASNIINGNLFFENTTTGANLPGSGANSFFENCLRNTTNIADATGATTYVNAGMGNFWGGINGTLGMEFSETCMDAGSTTTVQTDDDICDSPFVDGGTTDTAPLQICDAFFTTHNMILSKTALTFNDPVNGLQSGGNNPKAIPGATVLYTITATNQATDNRIGAASDVTITDDFTSQITGGVFSWNSNMVISSPDAGTNVPLLDPEDGDAGEFLSNLITAQCGDLNVGESCTLTFSLDIQ